MPFEATLLQNAHALTGVSGVLDMVIIFFAKYLPIFIVIAVFVFIFRKKSIKARSFIFLFSVFATLLARGVVAQTIKFLFDVPRPFEFLNFIPLLYESDSSFPSGHAVLLFTLAFAIWKFNKKWGIWLTICALLSSAGRILVGVHWASDIVGGIFVALISVFITHLLLSRFCPKEVADTDNDSPDKVGRVEL
jgi:undecaprenyl-diphosphatase